MKKIIVLSFLVLGFACKKDTKKTEPVTPTPNNTATEGSLKITLENYVDSLPLVFGNTYLNANGDTFTVNKFLYFVSNIVLTKADNSSFTVPNSYYLINKGNDLTKNNFTINGISPGSYKSITFLLGVDSTRNVSGAQEGDLAQSLGMFWTWTSGYIMLKLEGNSPQSGGPNNTIVYHTGGFSGADKVLQPVTLNFNSTIAIENSKTPHLVLKTDVAEIFKNPHTINFNTANYIMSAGSAARLLSENYAHMCSIKQVVQ